MALEANRGIVMRNIRHFVAAVAGTGLMALGAVATTAGAADAATHVSGCSKNAVLGVGVAPTCSSSGSVQHPTSIKLSVGGTFLSQLLNNPASLVGLGIKDQWSLSCWAGSRGIIKKSGTFQVTTAGILGGNRKTSTYLLYNNQLPSKCTVHSTVSTIGDLSLLSVKTLGVSDEVTATTAAAGDMWTGAARQRGTKCASGPLSGSTQPGTKAAVWNCGPSTRWSYGPTGEIVRNGVCLTNSAGRAVLENCAGWNNQTWYNSGHGQPVRSKSGGCLTVPSLRNGTQLRITRCDGKANQRWWIPPRAKR